MAYKNKQKQMRDFVITELIKGRLKYGKPLFEKKFFTSKFKVNPSYVDDVLKDLEKEDIIRKNGDSYIVFASDEKIAWLKDEFLHEYINVFLANINNINVSLNQAIEVLEQRNMANG
ncbi:GntR family transcriptional regulator [Anaerococcus cruorum]|uniref:GntR family transcriptional regulator n=1 Tax=Anaerococcus sp. WGS1529 TaxID=3366812 RepID=UPI00372D1EC3